MKFKTDKPLGLTIPIVLFLYVFLFQFTWSKPQITGDTLWATHVADSIIQEGNIDLDEYKDVIEKYPETSYATATVDGHLYSIFPIGTPILAVPLVLLIEKGLDPILSTDFHAALHEGFQPNVETATATKVQKAAATFIVSLTAVFIYLIGRLYFKKARYSLLLALIFAFGTAAWSTASLALWQHGPSMLMLSIALYIMLKAQKQPHLIQYAALPLAFSFVIRPTNSVPILMLTIYVLLKYKSYFLRYLIWASTLAVPFFIFNFLTFGSFLRRYNTPKIQPLDTFQEALAGNLISPGRGLFIFTPILLLSLWGIFIKIKQRNFVTLDHFLVAIIVLHWLVISGLTPGPWYAGYSYGSRYFTDVLPLFIYFLIPVGFKATNFHGVKKAALISVFVMLGAFSIFFNANGAVNPATWRWNATPDDVVNYPSRVWDWGDPQFLRITDEKNGSATGN